MRGGVNCRRNRYELDSLFPYNLDGEAGDVQVVESPGHTLDSVSVLVRTGGELGAVALAGDAFENEEDVWDENIWR